MGKVDVRVVTAGGKSAIVSVDKYTYVRAKTAMSPFRPLRRAARKADAVDAALRALLLESAVSGKTPSTLRSVDLIDRATRLGDS